MEDTDRIRQLEQEVARLIDRANRADTDRIHTDADLENCQRDLSARIGKLELWRSWAIGAFSVTLLLVGAVAGPIINRIKALVFG